MLFGELCWNLCQIYLRYIKRSGGTTEPDHRCVQVDSRFYTPDQFVRHSLDPGIKEEFQWHLLIPTNLFLTMTNFFLFLEHNGRCITSALYYLNIILLHYTYHYTCLLWSHWNWYIGSATLPITRGLPCVHST